MTRIMVFQLNRAPGDTGYGAVVVDDFGEDRQKVAEVALQGHVGGKPVLSYCEELEIIVEGYPE